jgi:hypothetical protein
MNALLFVLSAALAAPPTAVEAPLEILAEVQAKGVTAVFRGEPVPEGIDPSFGIRALSFRLDDGSELSFEPRGTLHHSDWFTGIFSQDGRWVLLPQDHYGPFHVVKLEELGEYLVGAEPFAVVGQDPGPGRGAWVHAEARWLNKRTVYYKAGLEELMAFTWELPRK